MKRPALPRSAAGFSLIEVLVVLAIIAIMAAVALPNIAGYLRNYQIRAATEQVAAEIQTARAQAIKRNVNNGVVVVVLNATQYRIAYEDVPGQMVQRPLTNAILTDPANTTDGPIRTLPQGVQFDTATSPAPSLRGLRFSRLGAMCQPGTTGCPVLPGGTSYIYQDTANGVDPTIQVVQPSTGLKRTLTVAPGGRVSTQQ
jgi:prepilin-type N-terminal cleavage/methylation domain-containing protein